MPSLQITRRSLLSVVAPAVALARYRQPQTRVFDVFHYGALGDGASNDTAAFQKAINAAAATGDNAQVLARGGHRYVVGTLELKSNMELHLADDCVLLASTHHEDYRGDALIFASGAHDTTISGTGSIDGRAKEFMERFDENRPIWIPRDWRPNILFAANCGNLHIRDVSFRDAPHRGLHMLACDGVAVEGLKVRNLMNMPNSDGISSDHCRNVVIRQCHLTCSEDAIVFKSSRQPKTFGVSDNIVVRDCVIETQAAGVRIGSETVGDIRDVRVENCEIRNSSRGLCIQLRDEGSISTVEFQNITLNSQYGPDRSRGLGEPISFTAIPRNPKAKIGRLHGVRVNNVNARAENSVLVSGCPQSRVRDVAFQKVSVTLDRWTAYPGSFYDDRASANAGVQKHDTPGFFISYADDVSLNNCSVSWGKHAPDYFSYAVEARKVQHLNIEHLKGHAAHPDRQKTTSIS